MDGQKNRDSLFIKYRRCILAGKKAPAGAHPGAQSLESPCFMYLRHKNQDYLFSKNRMSYFEKIKGFCYNPESDFLTRFSDETFNNLIPVNDTICRIGNFLYCLGVVYKTRWVLILI